LQDFHSVILVSFGLECACPHPRVIHEYTQIWLMSFIIIVEKNIASRIIMFVNDSTLFE